MTQELREDIQRRVIAVQRHYHEGGRVVRSLWVVAAVFVIIVGLAMTVLPGPAVVVIPLGLAMLAVRFRWAQWALREVINHGVRIHRSFVKANPAVRATVTAAVLVLVLGVAAIVR